MLHTKSQGHQPFGSREDIKGFLPSMGHLDHAIRTIYIKHNFLEAAKQTNVHFQQIATYLHTKFHQDSLNRLISMFLQHFDFFRYHSNLNFHATATNKVTSIIS